MKFKNKKIVIMGLGGYEQGSGIAAAVFFADEGAKVLVTDIKTRSYFNAPLKKLKKYKNIMFVFGKHRKVNILMFQKIPSILLLQKSTIFPFIMIGAYFSLRKITSLSE